MAAEFGRPTEKMSQNRSSEILGDRRHFVGKWRLFFRETVIKKFQQKFGTPVSEVRDPLVSQSANLQRSACSTEDDGAGRDGGTEGGENVRRSSEVRQCK